MAKGDPYNTLDDRDPYTGELYRGLEYTSEDRPATQGIPGPLQAVFPGREHPLTDTQRAIIRATIRAFNAATPLVVEEAAHNLPRFPSRTWRSVAAHAASYRKVDE